MRSDEYAKLRETEEGRICYEFYETQLVLLSDVASPLVDAGNRREGVAGILFQAIYQSSETLLLTADNLNYRDCAVVSRTIFETLVNMLFLLASDESVASDLVDHTNMKLVRDLDRTVTSGSASLKIFHPLKDVIIKDPEIQNAWKKFSTSDDKEIRHWTKKNLNHRLCVIEKVFGSKVVLALLFPFENYRFASEVLHGTLYGISHALGITMTGRPASDREHEMHRRQGVFSVLLRLGGALGEAAQVAANEEMAEEINSRLKANKDKYLPLVKKMLQSWPAKGRESASKE